jgi:agmatinase
LAGIVFTEYQPAKDVGGATAHVITRLILGIIGLQRQPQAIQLQS